MIYFYVVNGTGLLTASSYLDGATPVETTTTQTDWAGRTLTTAKGPQTTNQAYNSAGQLISSTDADGVRTLFAYNALGEQTTTAIDINGNGQIDFNGTDRITISTTAPATYSGYPVMSNTSDVYATNGSATATTVATSYHTPDGLRSWSISLGVANPSSRVIDPSTWTETTTNPDGTYTITTQTNGRFDHASTYASDATVLHTTTEGYDSLGRPVTSTDSRTGTTTTAYVSDTCDAVASTTDPSNRITSFTHDSSGRNLSTTLPDGTVSHISYHPDGQVAATWGSQTYPTFITYDYAGRRKTLRTQPTLASGIPTDTGGSLTTWNYSNTTGLLTSKQDDAGKGVSYIYTAAGRLTSRTWGRSSVAHPMITTYSYSTAGELNTTDYSDTTPDTAITFDRLGRQLTQSNGLAQSSFTYDPATLAPDTETITYDLNLDGTPDLTRVLDRSRDTLGRDTGFQLKDGTTIENQTAYGYSATDGRLQTASGGGFQPPSPSNTFSYSYLPNSNLISSIAGPIHTVTNIWEPNRNVLASKKNKVGADIVSQYDYTVNAIGQRTGVITSGAAFPSLPTWLWGYDSLGQVISADSSINTSDRAYQYDSIGNRQRATASTLDINDSSATNYTTNALNQYTTVSSTNPVHDDDGNMINGPFPVAPTANSTLIWDSENRLISATVNGVTITHLYDSQSRKIATSTGGNTTLYIYDSWNCIAEYSFSALSTPNSALLRSRLWGLDLSGTLHGAGGVGGLLSEFQITNISISNNFYSTCDGNGNVSEYLNSSGAITAHFEYDPFGNTVINTDAANLFSYRFSTKPLDFTTGLYYYGYRWYDPMTGRWLSRDPIEEQGGINLYEFGRNDLVSYIDPLGLLIESIWDVASIVYDVGKITVGVVVNNPVLVAEGTIDLATDTVALLIPGVPAGGSKVVRIFRSGKAARKALAEGADVVVKVRKSRKVTQINNPRNIAGMELQQHVTDILRQDVIGTNVKITVKTCSGKTINAELDVLVKETAYELKNWGVIRPFDAKKMVAQVERQTDIVKAFNGKHGGVIVGDKTTISDAAQRVFQQRGVPVWRAVEGELRAVVSVK